MALLDKVPGELDLYIGGLFTLRRKAALQECNITHVLTALRLPLEQDLFESYKHFVVEVDDVDDENILEHFPSTNQFIQDGLDSGGGVLVHCAMGKSRSATLVIAYLMHKYHISPSQALEQIRQSRPLCEPNEGFMHQLELYHAMQTPEDVESTPAYQRWIYQREVEMSRACGQAPEADKIRFEDEHTTASAEADTSNGGFELRCRKCRRGLATSTFVMDHQPLRTSPAGCSHYFLDPLSWMRPELEQGKLDGRIECPKCKTNVGKYAWQGMRCNCGEWIVPAISLAKGRIDEHKAQTSRTDTMGIRMPALATPTSSRPSGQGNL